MAIGQPNGGRMRANIHTIKSALRGRWESVLARHAPALHPALQRRGQHVPCPIHGGRDGFRVFRDVAETGGGVCNTCGVFHDGIALLAWVNDWSISQVVDCLQDELRSSSTVAFTRPILTQTPRRSGVDATYIHRLWQQSKAIHSDAAAPLQHYWQHRGLMLDEVSTAHTGLRFHPGLPYFSSEGRCIGEYPALLADVRSPSAQRVTLHRIYLATNGHKADVPCPKKLMPVIHGQQLSGSAIALGCLSADDTRMGICEGIETALAVQQATGQIVWSAINAQLLSAFVPPPHITHVDIWVDADKSRTGQRAAARLYRRLRTLGITSTLHFPPLPLYGSNSRDWNDVLNSYGTLGFPHIDNSVIPLRERKQGR